MEDLFHEYEEPDDELRLSGYRYKKACKGKIKHQKKGHARAARDNLYASPYWDGKSINIYRCPFCLKWHLGHGKGASQEIGWEAEECV